MNIVFSIKYHTLEGEHISVEYSVGGKRVVSPLSSRDGHLWRAAIELSLGEENLETLSYSYALYRGEERLRGEIFTTPHFIELDDRFRGGYTVDDAWGDLPKENYRYSAAFNGAQITTTSSDTFDDDGCITLRAVAPALSREGLTLGLLGSCEAMGLWREESVVMMKELSENLWTITLPRNSMPQSVEYKFVAVDCVTSKVVMWEQGENHTLRKDDTFGGSCYLPSHSEVFFPRQPIRIAGSAIPIFSLRSEGGCGVGDFGDLKEYILWASETKQRAVQILPINDTTINNTWKDSYPYNSISIYAFNPMYIDLRGLPALSDKQYMLSFEPQRAALNALPEMDYEQVSALKRDYLRKAFSEQGEELLGSQPFKLFFLSNRHWLQPYAAFSSLRDRFATADFSRWGEFSIYDKERVEELCAEQSSEYQNITFYYYVQYLLHIQLLEAADLARSLGIILKGDIPIGISRESVEAWVEPHYFNMSGQAGAPPDAFSADGQNWGFPTYNWEVMQRDNYLWWRRRFSKMADYFTAYRIDHILGFFRIWEIPDHSVHGLLGQFAPALPMSIEEIESWGVRFDKLSMTQPVINDAILDELFGASSDQVRQEFLQSQGDGTYAMLKEFDKQRKVEQYFISRSQDVATLELKEGLYSLISNLLFLEDRTTPNHFHPRITAQSSSAFSSLSGDQQQAFNALYNHYYYQRHNDFWYREAIKKLPVLIGSTSMLVCGEDLGMVPECVEPVMHNLQIISLEIERMPKVLGQEFGSPAHYPHSSVCTIGTHDMSTLRGWWREDRAQTQSYYNNQLGISGEAPTDATEEICREVVSRHLDSPSMLVVLTWQDWLSIDASLRNPNIEGERINIPANPRHYWRWRMHLSLEELRGNESLNSSIAEMICCSGRGC